MRLSSIEHLNTGYFATVMATGIISIALWVTNHYMLSQIFFYLAIGQYALLVILYLIRILYFPKRVWRDLRDAARVFGYFTFVAGTNVLGVRFAYGGEYRIALVLGVVGTLAWLGLTYFVLMYLLFYNQNPVSKVLSGTWLLSTVGAESIASLGSALAGFLTKYHVWLLFLSYTFWSIGIVLYLIIIALIIHHWFFHRVNPIDITPPYWINMGAVAITTLAGSRFIVYPDSTHFIIFIQPFVQGFTMMLWAWGTWWIPFLVLIGVWKYFILKQPFKYDPGLWSIVFPLGMFTAATDTLSHVQGLQLIHQVVPCCLVISVAVWCLVMCSFLISIFAANGPRTRPS